jgi:DNA repair exonuclease SbcCD nuclease subunit
MKILTIGDPHLKITRFDLAKRFLEWVAYVVEKHKPDVVINLGDTFDTHSVIRSEVMTEFMNHVYSICKQIPYVYVVGNHDMYKPSDSKYHALSHLVGKIDNFYVIDKVTNLFDITFVPYIHDPTLFPKETLPICICHQTFKGADYGDITTRDGVDPVSIEGTEVFISGHIHKRQRINYDSSNGSTKQVIYVGSPFSQSVSDVNQSKGLSIFDTRSLKEEFIECPLPMWRSASFEITQSFSTDDLHTFMCSSVKDSKDHWVVDITGKKSEISKYLTSNLYKSTIQGVDVKIRANFTDREKRQVKINSLSMEDIISQYVVKVYNGSLDKKNITEKAIEILKISESQ